MNVMSVNESYVKYESLMQVRTVCKCRLNLHPRGYGGIIRRAENGERNIEIMNFV